MFASVSYPMMEASCGLTIGTQLTMMAYMVGVTGKQPGFSAADGM
jgi:hypothetical protein